jgi:hypothetical protein
MPSLQQPEAHVGLALFDASKPGFAALTPDLALQRSLAGGGD